MSLVSFDDYKNVLKLPNDDEQAKIEHYSHEIDARIKAYLGFDIEETNYEEIYNGSGRHYLCPANTPVTTITKLEVYEGLDSYDAEDWDEWEQGIDYDRLLIVRDGFIIFMDGAVFPEGEQNIRLTYTAGYTSDTLPQDIFSVCRELMILKYRNIDKGVLSKGSVSVGMGSNVTETYEMDEDKILKKIEHYRLVRV